MFLFLVRMTAVFALFFSVHAKGIDKPTSSPSTSDRISSARDRISTQQWASALAELQLALREEPNNADVHNLLGYTYRKLSPRNLPKAFAHYNRAIQLDPEHKGAHEYIGEAYLLSGNLKDAKKHLTILERLCNGKACEEYADLAAAIEKFKQQK